MQCSRWIRTAGCTSPSGTASMTRRRAPPLSPPPPSASPGLHPAYLVPRERNEGVPLQTRNLVIGASPDTAFKSDTVQVPPGATFYLFSDGVFEITTADGHQWT